MCLTLLSYNSAYVSKTVLLWLMWLHSWPLSIKLLVVSDVMHVHSEWNMKISFSYASAAARMNNLRYYRTMWSSLILPSCTLSFTCTMQLVGTIDDDLWSDPVVHAKKTQTNFVFVTVKEELQHCTLTRRASPVKSRAAVPVSLAGQRGLAGQRLLHALQVSLVSILAHVQLGNSHQSDIWPRGGRGRGRG